MTSWNRERRIPLSVAHAPIVRNPPHSSSSRSFASTLRSSSVVVSPVDSRPAAMSRSRRRMILPLRVFGSASVKRISSGRASAPISFATCAFSSFFSSSVGVDALLQRHEAADAFALDLVRPADDRRLGDLRVVHQGALDLHRAQAMAARRSARRRRGP